MRTVFLDAEALPPDADLGLAAGFLGRLRENGVLAGSLSVDQVRFVTHRDVPRADLDTAIERIRKACSVSSVR